MSLTCHTLPLLLSLTLGVGALAAPAMAHPAPAAADKSAARFNLDTPIEALVADARAKAVVERFFPGIDKHEHYPMFKAMSLREVAPNAGDMLTPEKLKQIEAALAEIR